MKKAAITYQAILQACKKANITVKHFKWNKKYNYDSLVDQLDNEIHIDVDLAYTRLGCYILSHEIGHLADFKKGRFQKFYFAQEKSLPDTPKNRKLVEEAEWSANLFAQRLLKQAGLSVKPLKEAKKSHFKKERLPEYFKFYLKSK